MMMWRWWYYDDNYDDDYDGQQVKEGTTQRAFIEMDTNMDGGLSLQVICFCFFDYEDSGEGGVFECCSLGLKDTRWFYGRQGVSKSVRGVRGAEWCQGFSDF